MFKEFLRLLGRSQDSLVGAKSQAALLLIGTAVVLLLLFWLIRLG